MMATDTAADAGTTAPNEPIISMERGSSIQSSASMYRFPVRIRGRLVLLNSSDGSFPLSIHPVTCSVKPSSRLSEMGPTARFADQR